jgi:hypothetical protein
MENSCSIYGTPWYRANSSNLFRAFSSAPRNSLKITPMIEMENRNEVHEHLHRLLEGMARAVAAKGYADTTIADIVREAGVSRRTWRSLLDLVEPSSQLFRAVIQSDA